MAQEDAYTLNYKIQGEVQRSGVEHFSDSLGGAEFLGELINQLNQEGFLMAQISRENASGDSLKTVVLETGKPFFGGDWRREMSPGIFCLGVEWI
ncbi:hypothetical protein QWY93_04515 [Echinicola jeungdonensis]|uniref:hypothetical protein n=1 Tax=Echinicola jeungdonensis TaxID=709343 RepID=UPI0025B3D7C4|nr:hypothetical protein [Echinicola jeungdonensis]MDN3668586.1 hypothetical protein [Echinicola jeungdonensis]